MTGAGQPAVSGCVGPYGSAIPEISVRSARQPRRGHLFRPGFQCHSFAQENFAYMTYITVTSTQNTRPAGKLQRQKRHRPPAKPKETRSLTTLTVTESFRMMRAMNELARKDPNLAPQPAFARTPANCASAFASSSYGTRNASYVRAIQDHRQSVGVADSAQSPRK